MGDQQQGMMDRSVDVVLCIDATSSMTKTLNMVKEYALSFHQKLVEALEDKDREVEQLRVKVIAFRDFGVDGDKAIEESEFFSLPDEQDKFSDFVKGIKPLGGGDIPENALEAIALAMKSDWTTEGSGQRHCIVVFTDAPALELGKRAGSANYPEGMPKDLKELGDWWEGSMGQEFPYKKSAGRLVVFAPDAYPWNEIETWDRYWHAPTTMEGLADVNIDMVMDLLSGSIESSEE